MARFTRLFDGQKSNIISHRTGGDEVDIALTEIYQATNMAIQDIVRASIISYNEKLKIDKDKKILKQQKRTDSDE